MVDLRMARRRWWYTLGLSGIWLMLKAGEAGLEIERPSYRYVQIVTLDSDKVSAIRIAWSLSFRTSLTEHIPSILPW